MITDQHSMSQPFGEQGDSSTGPSVMDADKRSKVEQLEDDPQADLKQAAVKRWLAKVKRAKNKWEPDMKRMKQDIAFAIGYQRLEQQSLETEEYTCNLVLRNVNQKVAALYARNPDAEWQQRERMYYQLWDGKMETMQQLAMKAAAGVPMMPQDMALIQDYNQGYQTEQGIAKVGETLQKAYQYQIDEHDPDFKLSMKSLVRRVATCGVGFVRVSFVREIDPLTSEGLGNSVVDQAKMLHTLMEELQDCSTDDPKYEQVKSLMASMQATLDGSMTTFDLNERLSFDFLPATNVIVDENCRNLKGFVGCRWIAIEYILPLSEVNAYFEIDIEASDVNKQYRGDGQVEEMNKGDKLNEEPVEPKVCVIEILDKQAKSCFYMMEGYKNYLKEPYPLEPEVKGFWPVFTLMFNDVETVADSQATIYPPSDVFLMRHPQKEFNRIREELRKHRNANAAKYLTKKGVLTEGDKDKLENADSNAVIELEGLIPNEDVSKALTPMAHDNIVPGDQRYDAAPMFQDILMSVGAQEANLGPPNPQGTATGQSIAEQSRSVGIASNIDDLDDFLCQLAEAGGSLLLQEMSRETVIQIVGPGAAWPDGPDRQNFLNEIYLKVAAGSSGRPNKAMDMQNWQMMVPLLMQAGANPQFIVRETIKRTDDKLNPQDAFPLTPPQTQGASPRPSGGPQSNGGKRPTNQPPANQGRPGPGQISRPSGQQLSQGSASMPPAQIQG